MNNWRLRLGAWLFRKRDFTPIPFIAVALFFVNPTPLSIAIGSSMAVLGEAIRFWGVSYIGGISRTRTAATGALIRTGPFSLVRNPLYVGNFFLSTGLVTISGAWFLVLVFVLLFAFQYHFIVQWEEANLRAKFGAEYEAYCRQVPRWVPRFSGYQGTARPDVSKALRSEWITWLAIFAVTALLALESRYHWIDEARRFF